MKKSENQTYNIQSINKHLLNILEANYYIELGNVDLKVLSKILNGHPIFFREIIYSDILSHGIGKITDDADNDINFQFNYLYTLHQKASSSKFILTCGTVNYIDETGVEKFAPIVVIPLTFNYLKREFVINSSPRLNSVFLRYLRKNKLVSAEQLKQLEDLDVNKISSVLDIDQICIDVNKITNFSIATNNYLTLMAVEYQDYVDQNTRFDGQRSILEMEDTELLQQYFKNIKSVLTTNIEQKYVLMKASLGESVVVDGRLATGKTRTAINLMADNIAKGKKILYVNQDLDNVNDLRRTLKILGLNPYVYDLTKNVWDIDDENTLAVLPFDGFNFNVISELDTYKNLYSKKYHGYPYSYILEKLAIRKAQGLKDVVKIEKILDQEEVNFVYNSLKEIEKHLEFVEPLGSNIWASLQSGKNAPTAQDIINNTKNFLEETKNLVKILDKFATKYNLEKVDDIFNFNRLIDQMVSFINVKPLVVWTENGFIDKAKKALNNISKYSDIHYNCYTYYKTNCRDTYEKGSIDEHFNTIINKHYEIIDNNSKDVQYVNKLLSSQEHFISLVDKIKKWAVDSIENHKHAVEHFDFETPASEQFVFLNKLHQLFDSLIVDEEWLKEFITNPKDLYVKSKQLIEENTLNLQTKEELSQYISLNELNYVSLSEMISTNNLVKVLKRHVSKQTLKLKRTNINKVATLVKTYYDQCTSIKDSLPANTSLNKFDEETWNNYLLYLDFISKLTPFETRNLIYFIKNVMKNPKVKLSKFIETLSRLKENENELEIIEHSLNEYNFKVTGTNFIESVKSIKSYIPYFEKVITSVNAILKCFKYPENVSTYDCLMLKETDKEYLKCIEYFKKNKSAYEEIFGKAYKDVDTQVTEILQSIDHFVDFVKRFKISSKVEETKIYSALLNDKIFSEFINNLSTFTNLYSSWFNALRGFSVCFYGGKMNLQNSTFKEIINTVSVYVDKIDQVEHIYHIEHILDSFYVYGLKDLPDGIQSGKYVIGIADEYLYSTMNKYYTQMMKEGYRKFNLPEFVKIADTYRKEEERYCETNLNDLRNKAKIFMQKNKVRNHDVFDEYNLSLLKSAPNYKKIFISDIDIFNNISDLSFFDLVIIDDAHLSTANKYINLVNANQVVVFGDRSFKTSVTNTLMHRIKIGSIIPLHKRYVEMKSHFHNSWQKDNQYIYSPKLSVNKLECTTINDMILKVVEEFKKYKDKIEKRNISIIVNNDQTRREVYRLLVNNLRQDFSIEDIINITNHGIRIISAHGESMRLSDSVYIWYDDIYELREMEKDIIRRNYVIAKQEIYICYQILKGKEQNDKLESINDFIGSTQLIDLHLEGITKIIYNRLTEKGVKVELGLGYIDLVIEKSNKNIGIILYGKRTDHSYSIIDEYLYYVSEYKKRGWDIYLYCMEDLFVKLDDVINEIIKISK